MNEQEQGQAFAKDLDALINRYANEFEMTYAMAIGIMQIKITTLCLESQPEEE